MSSLVLPLAPVEFGHRGGHTPPDIQLNSGAGVTDLQLAFSEPSESEEDAACSPPAKPALQAPEERRQSSALLAKVGRAEQPQVLPQ